MVRLLGSPGGRAIYPLIDDEDGAAVSYTYFHAKGSAFNIRFYQKQLVITVDKQRVATNVDYVESGQR